MRFTRGGAGALAWAVVLLGSTFGGSLPAIAGSRNSNDTYAGDYTGGSLPSGTFAVFQYLGYFRANAFFDSTGTELPGAHANVLEEVTRFAYLTKLGDHPFAIEAEVPFATLTDVNIPGTNNLVAGGLVEPVLHLTYFFVADAKLQRWLGFTNYFYFPLGRSYDNQRAVNVSTARQFTDVPQIGYTEGLEKLSPTLKNVFFDLIANVSLHTDGVDPVLVVNPATAPVPGVATYDALTQRPSYDVRAYLWYQPKPSLFVAVGVEKSWGGEQVATGGRFMATGLPIVTSLANLSLSKDDFLRGHFQAQAPIGTDFAIGGDLFHDFERVGGLRNDIGVELRLTKFFFPETAPTSASKRKRGG